nr:hypothetical protein [Deltaproteobacteria bacterium]
MPVQKKSLERMILVGLIIAVIAVIGYRFFEKKSPDALLPWQSDIGVPPAGQPGQPTEGGETILPSGEPSPALPPAEQPGEAAIPKTMRAQFNALPEISQQGIALLTAPEPPDSESLRQWIEAFFAYLDEQNYIKEYNLGQSTKDRYNTLMARLEENPPVVSEAALNFDTVLRNIIHFYEVLGVDNLPLAKKVIEEESVNSEAIMGVFHEYAVRHDPSQDEGVVVPSLPVRYEYASYLLTTIGGRSYLYRRDSRIRILTTYYAVLTLHEANVMTLNQYGIDIVPYLDSVAAEIAARNDLVLRDRYLAHLEDLKMTYAADRAR